MLVKGFEKSERKIFGLLRWVNNKFEEVSCFTNNFHNTAWLDQWLSTFFVNEIPITVYITVNLRARFSLSFILMYVFVYKVKINFIKKHYETWVAGTQLQEQVVMQKSILVMWPVQASPFWL